MVWMVREVRDAPTPSCQGLRGLDLSLGCPPLSWAPLELFVWVIRHNLRRTCVLWTQSHSLVVGIHLQVITLAACSKPCKQPWDARDVEVAAIMHLIRKGRSPWSSTHNRALWNSTAAATICTPAQVDVAELTTA